MEPNEIRLWAAAFPIRNALDAKDGLAIFVGERALNALAKRMPTKYLGELEFWRKALRNQHFFKIDGRSVCIACMAQRDNRTLSTICFDCYYDDFKLEILSVEESENCLRAGDWVGVKYETRKARR